MQTLTITLVLTPTKTACKSNLCQLIKFPLTIVNYGQGGNTKLSEVTLQGYLSQSLRRISFFDLENDSRGTECMEDKTGSKSK